jgi:segregation and condensation protein A
MLAVKTEVFEGPLDLLLHLIEKDELDITAVSLVKVTDQYLAALRAGDKIDLRALAEFVAVGATLLLIKSRALLPRSPEQAAVDDLEVEEIALDLTAQLEEYRTFKQAASFLRELDDRGHRSFVRVAPPPVDWLPTGLERITLKKLMSVLTRALEKLPPEPEPERLQRPVVSVAAQREKLLTTVRARGSLPFSQLLAECRTRTEVIVTFLALLDLWKADELRAEQAGVFGEIVLVVPSAAGVATA